MHPGKSLLMRNLRLLIAYDGTDFCGWQVQPGKPTIQSCLEDALGRITGSAVKLTGSGRTDAGVHALAMATHADIERELTAHRLREGLNALVRPQPISVLRVANLRPQTANTTVRVVRS